MATRRSIQGNSVALTRRQREVLALIGAGRTNPEIAQVLGITLAGAKWHVSELLGRLDVTSREDAAAYWREQNQLRARLARPFRALSGLGVLKIKVALGGAAAAAVAVGAVVVAVALYSDGPSDPAARADTTLSSPRLNEAEAAEHARFAAGEYLKMTDIPQKVSVGGRPLAAADMILVELVFTPAGSVPATLYLGPIGVRDEAIWSATLRRENLLVPEMGWSDGVVIVSVSFRDDTGTVSSASAQTISKALEVFPEPTPQPIDLSGRKRMGPFYPVTRIDTPELRLAITVYRTVDGTWCWAHNSEDGAGGGTSCGVSPQPESPELFSIGSGGGGFFQGKNAPGFAYGAASSSVMQVQLLFEADAPVVLGTVPFPPDTGLDWRAFATVLDPAWGKLLSVLALDSAGLEVGRYDSPTSRDVPPYVVAPLAPIAFSGSGDAKGGEFQLPPPAFPVQVAMLATHEADTTVDLICDTASVPLPLIDPSSSSLAGVTRSGDELHIQLPPGATRCSFDVRSSGEWAFRSP